MENAISYEEIDNLTELYRGGNKNVLETLSQKFQKIHDVQLLSKYLDSGSSFVRHFVIQRLGEIGSNEAQELLLNKIYNNFDRAAGLAALKQFKLHTIQEVEILIEMLEKRVPESPSIATMLGNMGDKRAVEPLIQTLKDQKSSLRYYAARALGKLGDIRAIPALEQMTQNDIGQTGGKFNHDIAKKAIDQIKQQTSQDENLL